MRYPRFMLVVSPRIQIPFSEFEFSFARSSGPGGQNVNKVNSKAVLRWNFHASPSLPWDVRARFLERFGNRLTNTGEVLLTSDRTRDQKMNQEDCLEKLREMLLAVAEPPKARKKTKPTYGSRQRNKASKQKQGAKKKERGRRDWEA